MKLAHVRRTATCLALGLAMFGSAGQARQRTGAAPEPGPAAPSGGIEILQIRPGIHVIAGSGGHVTVQAGEDGLVVVDTGTSIGSDTVLAAIRTISRAPIRYVINTSADADHAGGNAVIAQAGQSLMVGQPNVRDTFLDGTASILSAEQVLIRLSAPATGDRPGFPVAAWPTETFDDERKYMYLNGEGIEVFHQPAAHTDGDSIVFFRRSDVVVAGDILDTTQFPVIDVERGGSIHGLLDGLNRLVTLAIPSVPIISREAGTLVVPGHGRICDQFDVVEYRDMVSIVRDRIRELVESGSTLEQIIATEPTRGFTRRYGSTSGSWTTNDFVAAVYRGLRGGRS